MSWDIYKYIKFNPQELKDREVFSVYNSLNIYFVQRNTILTDSLADGLFLTELFSRGEYDNSLFSKKEEVEKIFGEYIKNFKNRKYLLVLPSEEYVINLKNEI